MVGQWLSQYVRVCEGGQVAVARTDNRLVTREVTDAPLVVYSVSREVADAPLLSREETIMSDRRSTGVAGHWLSQCARECKGEVGGRALAESKRPDVWEWCAWCSWGCEGGTGCEMRQLALGPSLSGDMRGTWLKGTSAMAARAAAGMGAERGRVAVWVSTRPGCRHTGVRCWGGRMGGGGGARAGLAVAGGAGVSGCVRAGAVVRGVRV